MQLDNQTKGGVLDVSDKKGTLMGDVTVWLRGVMMGMADVVPGFSGGTVALITGIYERLVIAISHFDFRLFRAIQSGRLREGAGHIDLRFLVALGFGIACGFVATLLTIHRLLESSSTRPYVIAAFMGMVIGSSWIVFRMIRSRAGRLNARQLAWVTLGCLVAAAICLTPQSSTDQPPHWYIFLCGMVAICAMILPGISGALILTILGAYEYLSGIGHDIAHRQNLAEGLLTASVFGFGCLLGLLSFSKILRRLFKAYPANTLAFLFGLMIGSLVKLWPFQHATGSGKTGYPIWPADFGPRELSILGTVALAATVILLLAGLANKKTIQRTSRISNG